MDDQIIEECAAEVLARLANVLPERADNGDLGEKVLEQALDIYYREVNLIELKDS